MKKTLAILVITPLFFTSCFYDTKPSSPAETPKTATGEQTLETTTGATIKKEIVSSGDTIEVDYVGTLEDGTVFDSSLEEFAKKTANYSSGRTYKPLSFTVGAGQMIKGFDTGVVGMKLGEKKILTIAPADAYGEAFKEQEVPVKYFQDIFTETVPAENFKDTITQTVALSALGAKGEGIKVGETIEAGTTKAKITKIEDGNVTLDIENTQNPFYGKKIKVGLKITSEGNTVTIKKITDKEITLSIINKANPFYGKKIKEGME
jgi:peptidylprolyl isomerase